MTIIYSFLAALGVLYMAISAVFFFFRCEDYHVYREAYKYLPQMKFSKGMHPGIIYADHPTFMYDTEDGYFDLTHDVSLHEDNWKIFDLYSWYYHRKFTKWFKENVDIDELNY